MRAGSLDRKITLLGRAAAEHNGFEVVPGIWEALGNRRASIKPAKGNERFEQLGDRAYAVKSVWLRSDSVTRTLTAENALLIDGELHELVSPPVEIGRRKGLEIHVLGTGRGLAE